MLFAFPQRVVANFLKSDLEIRGCGGRSSMRIKEIERLRDEGFCTLETQKSAAVFSFPSHGRNNSGLKAGWWNHFRMITTSLAAGRLRMGRNGGVAIEESGQIGFEHPAPFLRKPHELLAKIHPDWSALN